jgi:hypothetical protein
VPVSIEFLIGKGTFNVPEWHWGPLFVEGIYRAEKAFKMSLREPPEKAVTIRE